MKITSKDVGSRAVLTRLLVKIDQNPKYSRQIGLEDTSRFRSEADLKRKEGIEDAELTDGDPVCHPFV